MEQAPGLFGLASRQMRSRGEGSTRPTGALILGPVIPTRMMAIVLASAGVGLAAEINFPKLNDARFEISLVASEPDIVTPIGMAIDTNGRLFVVESHTHFPRSNYPGPKFDRLKIFDVSARLRSNGRGEGTTPDPVKPEISVFADGLYHSMNVAFAPDGTLYLTHRNGIVRYENVSAGAKTNAPQSIVRLETKGDYPHNGLGGITFSNDGWLYFGMGENLGEKYTLHGSGGTLITGGGEGGNIFRCRPDGTELERYATGVWNPFSLCFYGEYLLAVDNDPDSRPPCRLLDIVRGGDYGFKFRFGRAGLHPYLSWNGELPGTLPMMAGTGEAPSGIVRFDAARVPADYRGAVLVTSWGDHHLEVYRPKHFGASLRAEREILAQGDEWFRPVAIAAAPDGAIYFTDWVDKDYSVHGKGRIWRLALKSNFPEKNSGPIKISPNADRDRMNRLLREARDSEFIAALSDADPFIRSASVTRLAENQFRNRVMSEVDNRNAKTRLGTLLALRRAALENPATLLEKWLADADENVRLMALVWVGEQNVVSLSNKLSAALSGKSVSPWLLRAHTATVQILSGKKTPAAKIGALLTSNAEGVTKTRVLDLQSAPDSGPPLKLLADKSRRGENQLLIDAVRTLGESGGDAVVSVLLAVAVDKKNAEQLRAEAVVALSNVRLEPLPRLISLLDDSSSAVRMEVARALRMVGSEPGVKQALEKKLKSSNDEVLNEQLRSALAATGESGSSSFSGQPESDEAWRAVLAQKPGNVEAGQRVFLSPIAGCAKCHRIEDHGGMVGPDLSTIARAANRNKLIDSILHPSREIAPQFVAHAVESRDSETFTGIASEESSDGSVTLLTVGGKAVIVPAQQIISDTPLKTSLMPEGLQNILTRQDFRDLLAFLSSRN